MKYKMKIGPKLHVLIDGELFFPEYWPATNVCNELAIFLKVNTLEKEEEHYSGSYGGTESDPLSRYGNSIYRIRNDNLVIELESYWDDAVSSNQEEQFLQVCFDNDNLIYEIHKFIKKMGFVTYTRKNA